MDQPPAWHLQTRRLQGRVPPLGAAQEQAGHELRDHGPSTQVLLRPWHPQQSGRPEAGVPVCRCAEEHRGDRLHWLLESSVS